MTQDLGEAALAVFSFCTSVPLPLPLPLFPTIPPLPPLPPGSSYVHLSAQSRLHDHLKYAGKHMKLFLQQAMLLLLTLLCRKHFRGTGRNDPAAPLNCSNTAYYQCMLQEWPHTLPTVLYVV